MAAELNKSVGNIGARRLHTVMERIMEEMSFLKLLNRSWYQNGCYQDLFWRLKDVTMKTDLSSSFL
jgi:ATP-dependent protease HslVU (ClpYQ) ATPase subunit